MSKDQTINFLYQSITDIQATIRAIDVKLGFVFALIFSPLVGIPEIVKIYKFVFSDSDFCLLKIITVCAGILWLISAFILFISVAAISDPRKHIRIEKQVAGCFYGGGKFKLSWKDDLYSTAVSSNKTLEEEVALIPKDEDGLINELVFEKMKISYIRDIKINRSRRCMQLTFAWVIVGGFIWGYYKSVCSGVC